MTAQQFERDFEEMMQGIPDLQAALVTYQEARQRITDRRRARGFWPSKSRGKGHAGQGLSVRCSLCMVAKVGRKGGRRNSY